MRIDRKTLNGGTFLLLLNIVFAIGFFIYERYLEPTPELDLERYHFPDRRKKEGFKPDTLFPFDPNELKLEGWKKLGLTKEEAETLLKYRNSGARFYDKEDLLKVYSIGQEELKAWKGYLEFPNRSRERKKGRKEKKSNEKTQEPEQEVDPFPFDPNRISKKEWMKLGLSEKQAEVALSYRRSGAKFWEPEDLLKLYVVDSSLFQIWKPYIRIDRGALKIPIDRADKEELKRLPGVGKKRAGRILKYRRLLGGFRTTDQLKEVYGISDSLFQELQEQLKIEEGELEKIPIDTTAKRLMRHPYIEPETAEKIIGYRKRYGPFQEKKELRKMDLLSDEEYRKIAPYLRLSDYER